jgi:hypothetical protein
MKAISNIIVTRVVYFILTLACCQGFDCKTSKKFFLVNEMANLLIVSKKYELAYI